MLSHFLLYSVVLFLRSINFAVCLILSFMLIRSTEAETRIDSRTSGKIFLRLRITFDKYSERKEKYSLRTSFLFHSYLMNSSLLSSITNWRSFYDKFLFHSVLSFTLYIFLAMFHRQSNEISFVCQVKKNFLFEVDSFSVTELHRTAENDSNLILYLKKRISKNVSFPWVLK